MILILVGLLVIFLCLWFIRKPKKEKEQPPAPIPAPVIVVKDRTEFDKKEELRKETQKLARDEILLARGYTETLISEEKASMDNQYRGKRTYKTVGRVGNGFENLPIADEEDISRPGIYGIYAGATLLYVGKSDRPMVDRLKEHSKAAKYIEEGGAQQNFLYRAMRDHSDKLEARVLAYAFEDNKEEIAQLEKKLIKELDPVCNIIRG